MVVLNRALLNIWLRVLLRAPLAASNGPLRRSLTEQKFGESMFVIRTGISFLCDIFRLSTRKYVAEVAHSLSETRGLFLPAKNARIRKNTWYDINGTCYLSIANENLFLFHSR